MNYLGNQDISEEVDDSLTGNIIGIEIKSVSAIAPIHEGQLLSYLWLFGACSRGLLINFNVKRLEPV